MISSRIAFKVLALTTVGFAIPIMILLSLEYTGDGFEDRPSWTTLLLRHTPIAASISLLFLASAITSSTRRKIVTFVQSLCLHAVIFVVFAAMFSPIQHSKADEIQRGNLVWIPFVAVTLLCLALTAIGNFPVVVKGQAPNR